MKIAWHSPNSEIIVACFISGEFVYILGSNHFQLGWFFLASVFLLYQDSNSLGHQGLNGKRSWAL